MMIAVGRMPGNVDMESALQFIGAIHHRGFMEVHADSGQSRDINDGGPPVVCHTWSTHK